MRLNVASGLDHFIDQEMIWRRIINYVTAGSNPISQILPPMTSLWRDVAGFRYEVFPFCIIPQ